MIPISENISNTVGFFQTAFTIVFALAIGEAFKQFIADKAEKPEDRIIHWDRLPALISFIFLAFPFFHGMVRYFFLAYRSEKALPADYGMYLAFDGLAFITMSALFFAMSRTLSAIQWKRYFAFIMLLLLVDTVWILVAVGTRGFPIALWLSLNGALFAVLTGLLATLNSARPRAALFASAICAATVITTTSISYYYKWDVFFPRS